MPGEEMSQQSRQTGPRRSASGWPPHPPNVSRQLASPSAKLSLRRVHFLTSPPATRRKSLPPHELRARGRPSARGGVASRTAFYMTVRGSPQRHRWVGDVPGPAATPSQLNLTVMAIAHSSEIKQTMLGAAGATRRQRGERNMNATAPIAPAGPQHMRALARANQIRLARAELKRGVAAGKIDVAEVIVSCPWEANGMAVADLLISQRRWGEIRCHNPPAPLPTSA